MAFDIKLVQAKYIQNVLHPEDMPSIATDALEAGIDTPSLRRLAGLVNPTAWEAEPLWKSTLSELKVADQSKHEAMLLIADSIAKQVISGECDVLKGLTSLEQLCSVNRYPEELVGFYQIADAACWGEYAMSVEERIKATRDEARNYLEMRINK